MQNLLPPVGSGLSSALIVKLAQAIPLVQYVKEERDPHGPCVSDRRGPGKMVRTEKSVADEFWSFFGSGTNLQELYISPHLLTPTMWDSLATAAKWSRANSDVLVDTHWIGGDPGAGEVYGWASWRPRGGIVVLRNPAGEERVHAGGLVSRPVGRRRAGAQTTPRTRSGSSW